MNESSAPSTGSLAERLKAGRFVITAELAPPVSCDAADLLARALPLKGVADAVNVTDGAGARAHMAALAAALARRSSALQDTGGASSAVMTKRPALRRASSESVDGAELSFIAGTRWAARRGTSAYMLWRGRAIAVSGQESRAPLESCGT